MQTLTPIGPGAIVVTPRATAATPPLRPRPPARSAPPWDAAAARAVGSQGVRIAARLSSQAALLWLLDEGGTLAARLFRLPLPGNLVGLLLLLALLSSGVIRPDQLREAGGLVGRHLSFFFLPYLVGVMTWSSLFATSGLAIAVVLVGSTVLSLAAAGWAAQCFMRRRS